MTVTEPLNASMLFTSILVIAAQRTLLTLNGPTRGSMEAMMSVPKQTVDPTSAAVF